MMKPIQNPLSPHLQIYKLPLTGLISISHRITGVFLCFGLVLFVNTLWGIAGGEAEYNQMQTVLNWTICKLIYWGFIYALFFHLVHGIRHLIWDAGSSFELSTMNLLALGELCLSFLLTLITFWYF